jgi:hypothetical protein
MAFRAVEWVRRVRDAQYEQTRDMSFDQRLAFYRSKSQALRRSIARMRRKALSAKN